MYVTDVDTGTITVIDPETRKSGPVSRPSRASGRCASPANGRWGMVVNSSTDTVFVSSTPPPIGWHTSISVGKQPYEVSFTTSFAYVRSLGTQDVGLIPMSETGRNGNTAGDLHPGRSADRRA